MLWPLYATAQPLSVPLHVVAPEAPRVRVDGRLDEGVWASATAFGNFRRFRPDTQLDPGAYRTEFRVLIERGALVFGIRAWDPQPAEIQAPLARRDRIWPDQDNVTVWLDPSGRGQVAQFVRVNASGSMGDGIYTAHDGEEDSAPDFQEVEVAAARLPDGYSVEIRWPLSVLRYPLSGQLPWGVMVTRRVPRASTSSYASAPLDRDQPHLLTQLQRFSDDSALREQLDSQTHLLLRAETTVRRLDDGNGSAQSRANLGLELQWRPRADWVIDAIVRPDFSQVELDAPQLSGNNRFALFQQEKRAFFLESSDVVGQVPPDDSGVSRGLLAFYSRAVTDPRWGLRATYRGIDSEATVLSAQDAGGGVVLRPNAFSTQSVPVDQSSNILFARHRTSFANGLAAAGIVSVRDWGGGAATQVVGFDSQLDVSSTDQLRGNVLASRNTTALVSTPSGQSVRNGPAQNGLATWLQWRHRAESWKWGFHWEHISPGFVSDNGFVPQSGIGRTAFHVERDVRHFLPEDSPIDAWELKLHLVDTQALSDPANGVIRTQLASQSVQPGMYIQGPRNTGAWLHWVLERTRTRADGTVHQPRSIAVGVESNPGARLTYATLEGTFGERIDVDADRVGPGFHGSGQVVWRHTVGGVGVELEQRLSQGKVSAPNGPGGLDERSLQTKLILHLSAQQAVRLVHQRNAFVRSAEPGFNANEASGTVSTLTWLARAGAMRGWSVGASWAQDEERPANRELFVKYNQGWHLR